MKILKFGGSSLATAEKMRKALRIINDVEGQKIVVLSAIGETTNRLLRIVSHIKSENRKKAAYIHSRLFGDYKEHVEMLFHSSSYVEAAVRAISKHFKRVEDLIDEPYSLTNEKEISAQGELMSTALFYLLCEELEIDSALIPAMSYMKINGRGVPDFNYIKSKIKETFDRLPSAAIYITQGYICQNQYNNYDNLGRGGSDYTATIIGEAIRAKEVQIWTDIDGLHNNDPRFVERTRPVHGISYSEAERLAFYGAKVLHPLSVMPVKRAAIPLWIKNTFNPGDFGTLIGETPRCMDDNIISIQHDEILITIDSNNLISENDFFSTVIQVFNIQNVKIDMMSVSYQSLAMAVNKYADIDKLLSELEKIASITVEHHFSIVYISGSFNKKRQNDVCHLLDRIKDISVKMISHAKDSCSYLLLLVNSKDGVTVLNRLGQDMGEGAASVSRQSESHTGADYDQMELVVKER